MPVNVVEQGLLDKYPALIRIPEKVGAPPISVTITKNHYPDFKILFPEDKAGLWVECKGHIRDRLYLHMLRHFPEDLKQYYRVVLVQSSKNERQKVGKTLTKIGIKWSEFTIPDQWFVDAKDLWEKANAESLA